MSISRSGSFSETRSRSSSGYLFSKPDGPRKIIDLIHEKSAQNKQWFSFEYFPPKTDAGVTNLYNRIEQMSLAEPLFLDITWGAGGSTADLTLDLATTMQQSFGPEVMMHLTCTNMSRDAILEALKTAKEHGVRNILALRGDPPHGNQEWTACDNGFSYAADLVKLIREEFGDWFGVGVAGYPEGHTDSTDLELDMKHLKEKVDAGADFIVTQLFYDCDLFFEWVKKCRAIGIEIPILPGIMPIQSYNGFIRMTSFCKTFVPETIMKALEPIQNDDAAVRRYGVTLAAEMCQELLGNGIPGVHLYTLNLQQSCMEILEEVGMVVPAAVKSPGANNRRQLPWKQSQSSRRNQKESVRPIFWSNRVESYLSRSQAWDSYPNGRFGNSNSPAYGELSNYFMCQPRHGSAADRRKVWGEAPETIADIASIFAQFITGEVPRLPWCETALSLESQQLLEKLITMNNKGIFTINSQPAVNAAPSDHPAYGWGPSNGYVFQKAYLEFFVSPENFARFIELAKDYPSLSYCAMNSNGERVSNYINEEQVTAVTWGVFPNSEILQPTVVDSKSFEVWKDEAFTLWLSLWQNIYEIDTKSYHLLQDVHDTYFLVNVVENDFVKGDLFEIFSKL